MNYYFNSLFASVILLSILTKFAECAVYKAGVVEYYYDLESKLDPKVILDSNVKQYGHIARNFSETWPAVTNGILVFPECGLSDQNHLNETGVIVPEPNFKNYNFSHLEVIGPLSDTAKKFSIWLVVNLIEKAADKFYNTDVVFANNGTIAAKYRKYNLYGEPVDKPAKVKIVSFMTDFNIKFGIFTCFDILYPHPALDLVKEGISHIIFPTAWYSELPFLTAIQYQKGWSWANNVTLLASGLSYSKVGNTGSGIYAGRTGHNFYFQSSNTFDSKILIVGFNISDKDSYTDTLDNAAESQSQEVINFIEISYPQKEQYYVESNAGSSLDDAANSQSQEDINSNEISYSEKEQYFVDDVNVRMKSEMNSNNLKIKQEHLDAYTTSLITPNGCKISSGDLNPGQILNCTTTLADRLCNHDFCCNFNVTTIFSLYVCAEDDCKDAKKHHPTTSAEDDFSLSEHRLAVFNGVRSFGVVTAGCQTCAVVSCRDGDIRSCGLTAVPGSINCYPYSEKYNVCVLRRYISFVDIEGDFSEDNTFITPNILLRCDFEASQFGKVPDDFLMTHTDGHYKLVYQVSSEDVLGTAAIWSRIFDRDGQPETGTSSSISFSIYILLSTVLIYPTLKFLKYM